MKKSISITMSLILLLSAAEVTAVVAADTNSAAQLETAVPVPEGAIPSDQTPPILSKPNNNPQNSPGSLAPTAPMSPTGGNASGTPAAAPSAGGTAPPAGAVGAPVGSPNALVGTPAAPGAGASPPIPAAPQPATPGTPPAN